MYASTGVLPLKAGQTAHQSLPLTPLAHQLQQFLHQPQTHVEKHARNLGLWEEKSQRLTKFADFGVLKWAMDGQLAHSFQTNNAQLLSHARVAVSVETKAVMSKAVTLRPQ